MSILAEVLIYKMYKWSIACMLIALVFILAISYYSEGFDVAPAPVATQGQPVAASGLAAAAEVEESEAKMPVPDMPADDVANPANSASVIANEKQEQSKLIRDVRDMLHNNILSERALSTPIAKSDKPAEPVKEDTVTGFQTIESKPSIVDQKAAQINTLGSSLKQGFEYAMGCPKMPDMSQYIRKDQIPCWNCNVEY